MNFIKNKIEIKILQLLIKKKVFNSINFKFEKYAVGIFKLLLQKIIECFDLGTHFF